MISDKHEYMSYMHVQYTWRLQPVISDTHEYMHVLYT